MLEALESLLLLTLWTQLMPESAQQEQQQIQSTQWTFPASSLETITIMLLPSNHRDGSVHDFHHILAAWYIIRLLV